MEEQGGKGVEQREHKENPLTTQPDRKIALSQTNRRVRGACVGVIPRVQSKLSRALHAHRGKKLLQDLQNLGNVATKRAMVRFRRAGKTICHDICGIPGGLARGHDGGAPFKQTLGRSLGPHNTAKLVGGMCHGFDCQQKTAYLYAISFTKTEWSSLTHK